MLPIRSSESPGPKVVLVLGEPRTAPEDLHQEIWLRETARCPKESDRPIEGQDRVGILRDDVDVVRDQEDRDVGVLLQPIEGLIEHVLAADVYHGGRLVGVEDIPPFGPTMASVVPLRTWKLTSSKIGTRSNRTPRFATRRRSSAAPVSWVGLGEGGVATTMRRCPSDAVI